ncbi:Cu(I)-responsive transcriptional regulator [Alcaligenaceae bacterium CGII-47]|nr:Cu(I)-responsive transcriptional regulator [Alcaligenaceae bacterium CGII-47]
MNIGQAAQASGISAKMIRYYETMNVLAPSTRNAAGYRQYSEQDLHALHFVRSARDLGFSLRQITDLMALWRDTHRASAEVKRLALSHIQELERKAAALQQMADTLRDLAQHCHGDSRPDCPILSGLAPDYSAGTHSVTKG